MLTRMLETSASCATCVRRAASLLLALATCASTLAGHADITIIKPSNTGVTGSEVRVLTFDAEGNLWIVGRWPFWGEIGIAMLPAEELPYTPLPGGGFDTGLWTVWSNIEHPIPSPYVNDLKFDADGVIWLASDGGLTRFDRFAATGEQWKTWNASNSPLILNGVRSMDFDADGHLWLTNTEVTTANGALFEFDPANETWTIFEVGDELPWFLPWKNVNAVRVGANGHVYVTHSTLGGFAEYDGKDWVLHDSAVPLDGILDDTKGNVWFSTSAYGLWRWNGTLFDSWPSIGGTSTITALSLGLDGSVFVSTWDGPVYRMIDDAPQFFLDADGLPGPVIQRPNGEIWINNYGSTLALGRVRHYSADGELLERLNSFNSGLPDYFVDNIQRDGDGNMWFATGDGGLSRMEGWSASPQSPTRWRNWGNHNDQSEPNPFAGNEPMYSMHEDANGLIWMGGNGVARWDPVTGMFLNFWNWQNSSLGVDSFVAIEEDGNGDIWIASDYTGLYRLNPETDDWEQHLFGAPFSTANEVHDMVRDLDGNLWVATLTSLHFFNGQTWFAVGAIHGSPVQEPRALAVHPDGSLWIGASNGLIRYQDGTWTIYDPSNSPMITAEVHGLDIREDGVIGMSLSKFQSLTPFPNGVVLFDPTPGAETWDIYTYEDDGLPHYQLGDVEFDSGGNLWVSTISEGVTRINVGRTTPAPSPDLNGDGVVDGADLGLLLAAWGTSSPAADLNQDGVIDGADLGALLAAWS